MYTAAGGSGTNAITPVRTPLPKGCDTDRAAEVGAIGDGSTPVGRPAPVLVAGSAATMTGVSPVPRVGLTVSQGASLMACHAPVDADTSRCTVRSPPPAGAIHVVSLIDADGSPPACATVTARPAIVTIPVRGCNGVVGATVRLIVALPCPLAGETAIQGTALDADHAASAADAVRPIEVSPTRFRHHNRSRRHRETGRHGRLGDRDGTAGDRDRSRTRDD